MTELEIKNFLLRDGYQIIYTGNDYLVLLKNKKEITFYTLIGYLTHNSVIQKIDKETDIEKFEERVKDEEKNIR